MSAGYRCTIDHTAHGLTVHANIGLHAEAHAPTAESPTGARAHGALARHTRPRAAARADPVHSTCQRRRQRPDSRRGSEEVEGFHLLRAHTDIAAREGMRHEGDMQECGSQHAEPCQ